VLLRYIERHGAAHQVVVDAARWPDPTLSAANVVHADPRLFCESVLEHVAREAGPGSDWLARWRRMDTVSREALESHGASLDEAFEGRALAEVTSLVPEGGTLFVSSSMPVRDLDAFAAGSGRALRVLANRGANGIDGVISTALGAAAAMKEQGGGKLVLVIGDIAFYHDMNGLLAGKLHGLDATIVVLNNDGGGIFSFLPQAAHPEHFEQLFGTPHGLEFSAAAELYGARYHRAKSWQSFREGVSAGIGGQGLHIVEMRTDRARNVVLHREAWDAVATALDNER
jgi:2-succinyl-5-enolpyruvyl-6-hydroxy-3-cyclohexene-1-carboxylate synthase